MGIIPGSSAFDDLALDGKITVDAFNGRSADTVKFQYFADPNHKPETIYDLGVVGRTESGALKAGSVIGVWQKQLGGG
jgi:hypothetical protein